MTTETRPPHPAAVFLSEVARPILLKYFSPNSCIESTAVALMFLRDQGVRCREMSVQLGIFNAAAWRLWHHGQSVINRSHEDRAAWDAVGAWSVGIGIIDTPLPRPGHYAGHLVAVVEDRWILDLSIDQAERLHRGIRLPEPVLVPLPPEGLVSWQPYQGPAGQILVYEPNQTIWAPAYKQTPAWRDKAAHRRVFFEISSTWSARRGGMGGGCAADR